MSLIDPVRNFYGRFERPISSLSLVLGFVFDALTLKRVDTLWENFWIFSHILVVGVFIVLIHAQESSQGDETDPSKKHFWYVNILQFFFGGILSAYLVFYFRSADIFVTWPFIALLAGAFIANESLKRHYVRLSFQISLFFLSIYSFAIFLLPVVLHRIGTWVFLLSGLLSLAFIAGFIAILFYFIKDKFSKSRRLIFFLVFGIYGVVNFLYFTNLIPPIPLSLKDAGVYHSMRKSSDGNYKFTYEHHGIGKYFTLFEGIHVHRGAPVYAYSAVFSPRGLDLSIIHEWQHYDEDARAWTTESTVPLYVKGGRDGGFRTYSVRPSTEEGKWRVNVETEDGHVIGVVRLNIIFSDEDQSLSVGEK